MAEDNLVPPTARAGDHSGELTLNIPLQTPETTEEERAAKARRDHRESMEHTKMKWVMSKRSPEEPSKSKMLWKEIARKCDLHLS